MAKRVLVTSEDPLLIRRIGQCLPFDMNIDTHFHRGHPHESLLLEVDPHLVIADSRWPEAKLAIADLANLRAEAHPSRQFSLLAVVDGSNEKLELELLKLGVDMVLPRPFKEKATRAAIFELLTSSAFRGNSVALPA